MNKLYLDNTITDINAGGNEMAITSTMDGASLPSENVNSTNDQPDQSQFKVHVKRKTLFWMLIKYGFLTIITLGIYRFWAKTKIRQYLWSTVELSGDRFEYHGTAKELFIGFLIALVILVPLSIVNEFISAALSANENNTVTIIYSIFIYSVFMLLFQFAFYRMRRYQLTRTSWRSIRFNLEKSALRYAAAVTLWIYGYVLTLGIITPWMDAWATNRIMNNTEFGTLKFRCKVEAKHLLKPYLFSYFITLLPLVIYFVLLVLEIKNFASSNDIIDNILNNTAILESFLISHYGLLILSLLGAIFGFFIYSIYVLRETINQTKLNGCKLNSSFSITKLIWPWLFTHIVKHLVFLVVFLLLSILSLSFTLGITFLLTDTGFSADTIGSILVGQPVYLILPLLIAMMFSRAVAAVLWPVTFMRTVLPAINLEEPNKIMAALQNNTATPTHGEGFADALDVGAF